ncbi:hypothetical protein Barb7_03223 [Bacteroidales bacterium Barb7]|nr:hypothetical protein Barb7_03223 [Bacteroidales bacterium Barb7]
MNIRIFLCQQRIPVNGISFYTGWKQKGLAYSDNRLNALVFFLLLQGESKCVIRASNIFARIGGKGEARHQGNVGQHGNAGQRDNGFECDIKHHILRYCQGILVHSIAHTVGRRQQAVVSQNKLCPVFAVGIRL